MEACWGSAKLRWSRACSSWGRRSAGWKSQSSVGISRAVILIIGNPQNSIDNYLSPSFTRISSNVAWLLVGLLVMPLRVRRLLLRHITHHKLQNVLYNTAVPYQIRVCVYIYTCIYNIYICVHINVEFIIVKRTMIHCSILFRLSGLRICVVAARVVSVLYFRAPGFGV